MKREEKINSKYGFDTANQSVAIYESATNDRILEFKRLDEFTNKFIKLQQNGEIWGVFYKDNKLVAQEVGGKILRNILI